MARDVFTGDARERSAARDPDDRNLTRRLRAKTFDLPSGASGGDQNDRAGQGVARQERESNRVDREDSPRAYHVRDRAYLLRGSQMHSLTEIGRFRVISVTDLATYSYREDGGRVEKDLRGLAQQGLLKDSTLEISRKRSLRVVTLTKAGHRLLSESNRLPEGQPIYHGLKKRREVAHDADLYKLYQKEAARIERSGGRPVRVLLDYEIKRHLNRDLARLGIEKDDPYRRAEIAGKHALPIVHGKITVPDLRVEYETPESELRHVDLELATRNYRPRAVAAKASAGFSLYGRSSDVPRLRRVLDEREITREIFAL
jgi:hypothetical protein